MAFANNSLYQGAISSPSKTAVCNPSGEQWLVHNFALFNPGGSAIIVNIYRYNGTERQYRTCNIGSEETVELVFSAEGLVVADGDEIRVEPESGTVNVFVDGTIES